MLESLKVTKYCLCSIIKFMLSTLQLQWPRTPSEKLLHDMFEGSSTQLLCLLEALNDTNRRILITSPPAPDSDVEILDVYAELFMAGQEILAGI